MSRSLPSPGGFAPYECIVTDGRVSSHVPGRIRINFSKFQSPCLLESDLRAIPGVADVELNSLTGSVLVRYEERHVDGETVFQYACLSNAGKTFSTSIPDWGVDAEPMRDILLVPALDRSPSDAVAPNDGVRIGLELLLGIVTADARAILACFLAAAVLCRKTGRAPVSGDYSN